MDEFNDLDTYNGDPLHDGWVDFDYNENSGELPDEFGDAELVVFVNNLYDWD